MIDIPPIAVEVHLVSMVLPDKTRKHHCRCYSRRKKRFGLYMMIMKDSFNHQMEIYLTMLLSWRRCWGLLYTNEWAWHRICLILSKCLKLQLGASPKNCSSCTVQIQNIVNMCHICENRVNDDLGYQVFWHCSDAHGPWRGKIFHDEEKSGCLMLQTLS